MKKFFKRIWSFIKMLFVNPESWIDQNIKPSIELVQNIKNFVDSPVAGVITSIIPGQWDDNLRKIFSTHLGVVIDLFVTDEEILNSTESWENKLAKLISWLKQLSPTVRAAVYAKLASRLAKENAGSTDVLVKNNSVDLLTQIVYSKQKSNVDENNLSRVNDNEFIPPQPLG